LYGQWYTTNSNLTLDFAPNAEKKDTWGAKKITAQNERLLHHITLAARKSGGLSANNRVTNSPLLN
jgi:hypothetical protein